MTILSCRLSGNRYVIFVDACEITYKNVISTKKVHSKTKILDLCSFWNGQFSWFSQRCTLNIKLLGITSFVMNKIKDFLKDLIKLNSWMFIRIKRDNLSAMLSSNSLKICFSQQNIQTMNMKICLYLCLHI